MEDNARKFIVEKIDDNFLSDNKAVSFVLVVDWLEAEEDSEKKLAYKKFDNGDIQILLISKVTDGNNRTADKKKITQEEYEKLLKSSILHLEKKRSEFKFIQNNITYDLKYDEFVINEFKMLEVDASTEEERNSFDPIKFPFKLTEVTGDLRYYGYKVAKII